MTLNIFNKMLKPVKKQAGTDTYNSSSVWRCPYGVTSVDVVAYGAGGVGEDGHGMDANPTTCGRGGGGGARCRNSSVPVTAGITYTVTVPPATTGVDEDGGYAQFIGNGSVTVKAAGGKGYSVGIGYGALGAVAGNCIGATYIHAGGNGGDRGDYSGGAGGGGCGTATGTGANGNSSVGTNGAIGGSDGGGAGGNTLLPGNNATTPGGGGGGGGRGSGGQPDTRRGNGAAGRITITY